MYKFQKIGFMSKLTAAVLSLILTLSPFELLNASANESDESVKYYKSTLQLDVQSTKIVTFKTMEAPKIVVGESEYNKRIREENEAKNRANEQNNASRDTVARESTRTSVSYTDDPGLAEKRALAKRAAAAYGIDWKILEAVWQVESGKSWDTKVRSSAGAQGPMQFMSGTWKAYGQDGNGDGVADAYNAQDALYGAANYLAAGGAASGNVDQALFNYNHAQWYVNKVKAVANSIED